MSRADDADDFERFARARLPALVRFAAAIAGDRLEAEDVVQSALARTWAAWPRVRRHDDPEGYVRRAITNEQIARWRRARRRDALPRQRASFVEPPGEPDDGLKAALAQLAPRMRAVVVLRYCEDRSEAETAEILGCSAGTVKSQASKALARLRAALAEESRTEEPLHD